MGRMAQACPMRTCSPSGTHIQLDKLNNLFPHHVARAEELIGLGLCGSSVYRRCQPGGPWQRVLPGVLVLGNSPPTLVQRMQAALRYAEPDGVLTGRHALLLHGMRSAPLMPDSPVHVLVPKGRSLQGYPEVRVERTTRMPKPLMRKGFLVAPLERALLDTARHFRVAEQVRRLITEAIWDHGLPPELIKAELTAGSGRGSALPRRVLAEVANGIRTDVEALAATLIGTARLPMGQSRYKDMRVMHGAATLDSGHLVGQAMHFVLTEQQRLPPKGAMMVAGTKGEAPLVRTLQFENTATTNAAPKAAP